MLVTKTDRTVCVCPSAGSNGRRLLQATLRCEAQREKASAVSTRARRAVTGHTSVVPLLSPCGLPDGYVSLTRPWRTRGKFPSSSLFYRLLSRMQSAGEATAAADINAPWKRHTPTQTITALLARRAIDGCAFLFAACPLRAHPVYTVQFVA